MSLYDFSLQIKTLNKDKKFAEALAHFKANKAAFCVDEIGKNKYVVYEVITACIALNHYEAIFVFIERYNIVLEANSLFYLLKQAKNKLTVNWKFIERFCDLIPASNLSTSCVQKCLNVKGQDKTIEFASEKEDWYAYKTKALYELGKFDDCCRLSTMALSDLDKFHYGNDIWFARRIALSKKQLGNLEDALQELGHILKQKKEWFIQYEIASIYFEKKAYSKAFEYGVLALTNFGDLAYKVGLIEFFATVLEQMKMPELAWKHLQLSYLLRLKAEWAVPENLQHRIAHIGNQFEVEDNLERLMKELKVYWKKCLPQKEEVSAELQGKIASLLHSNEQGVDGFINYKQQQVYFRLGAGHRFSKNVKTGMPVVFKIMTSNEKNKRKRAIITRIVEHTNM
jgi:tetratricopeptide (TPR) repeat protein